MSHLRCLAALGALFASLALTVVPAAVANVHSFASSISGTDAPSGGFSGPVSAAVEQSSGDLWISDNGHGVVDKFDSSTGAYISGSELAVPGAYGVAVDNSGGASNGDIYVSEYSNNKVDKLDPSTGALVSSFGSSGQIAGFNLPLGVTVDSSGNLYVANYSANVVDKFDQNGNPDPTTPLIGSGHLSGPRQVAIDSTGNVYVASDAGVVEFQPNGTCVNSCNPIDPNVSRGIGIDASDNVYVDRSSSIAEYDSSPSHTLLETFGSQISFGVGLAVNGPFVYVPDVVTNTVNVFVDASALPVAATGPPSNLTRTSATISGNVDPNGAGNVTGCHFQWGATTVYGNTAPCLDAAGTVIGTPANPIVAPANVHADLSGLTGNTNYHYRLRASNAIAVPSTGTDQTFRTNGPPLVEEQSSAEVGDTAATVRAQLNPNGFSTTYHFDYVDDVTYKADVEASGQGHGFDHATSTAESTSIGSDSISHPASAGLANLQPSTVYDFRVVATNSDSSTLGATQTFATFPSLPAIDSTSASNPTQTTVTLGAQINPGFGPTIYRFEYGGDSSYGSKTLYSDLIGNDGAVHAVAAQVAGLTPATLYHFRVRAVNFSGVTVGPDQTFATVDAPFITATSVLALTQTSAQLGAQITPNFSPTTYHFEYGPTSSYGSRTPETSSIGADHAAHTARADISGLSPGTTYHFRVVATNSVGTSPGADQTFTSAPVSGARGDRTSVKCKKGFLKRHGKCVKARHKQKHHESSRGHRHG